MGWHLHRDEGHLDDETGKPKHNYHIHLAYTNLKDGQVTHMDVIRMKKAQDICAEVLNMPRGKPHKETGRVSMDHKQYRQHARALAAEKKKTRTAEKRAEAKNETLKTALAGEKNGRKGEKTRADNADAELEKQKTEYKELGDANRILRQRLKDSGQARQEDYQTLKRIMTDTTLNKYDRAEAAGDWVDERLAHSEPANSKDLLDVNKAVAEPIRYKNAAPSLGPVVRELVREKEKRQQAESAARAANQRVEVVEKALPETGWTMPRVKTKREKKFLRPDQRVETETASQYRRRVDEDIDLYLSKQRKADRAALEKEEEQAKKQATAAAETNVQQELQRLQAQETGYLALQTEHQVLKETNKTLVTERNAWKKKYDDMVAHVKPYLEALKQLPERLVSVFNDYLYALTEHVKKKDKEKEQDSGREH